jgi:hypothetical protein
MQSYFWVHVCELDELELSGAPQATKVNDRATAIRVLRIKGLLLGGVVGD